MEAGRLPRRTRAHLATPHDCANPIPMLVEMGRVVGCHARNFVGVGLLMKPSLHRVADTIAGVRTRVVAAELHLDRDIGVGPEIQQLKRAVGVFVAHSEQYLGFDAAIGRHSARYPRVPALFCPLSGLGTQAVDVRDRRKPACKLVDAVAIGIFINIGV